MADNVTLDPGTGGAVIKTDDDGVAHWQYVKVAFGADNTQTRVTSSSGLPVTILAGSASIGTLGANSGVDIGDVDVTSVPAPLSTTGGGTEAAALRVTIATDSTGVVSIDDNGGSLTVDGTVTANLSATDNAVLDQLEVNTSYGDNTGGGVELGALRVTIASDSTGLISVDDNGSTLSIDDGGGSITVDGTVTETNSSSALTALQLIDDAVHTDDAAFTLGTGKGVMMMGFAGPQTVDSSDAAALACTTGGILHVNLQGDTLNGLDVEGSVAHDSADSGNPVKTGAKSVDFDGTPPPNTAATEGDRVNHIADQYGRQYVEITHPNYWDVSVDYAAAQTNTTVKATPGVGLSLYITDVIISNGATAGNITLLDGSGGDVLLECYPAITGGLTHSFRSPIKLTANTLLAITSTTVTTHSVTVCGFTAP